MEAHPGLAFWATVAKRLPCSGRAASYPALRLHAESGQHLSPGPSSWAWAPGVFQHKILSSIHRWLTEGGSLCQATPQQDMLLYLGAGCISCLWNQSVITPSPRAWRPDFPGAAREAP